MSTGWAVIIGLSLQTVVIVGSLLRLHGAAMRKIGEFETKVDVMWAVYVSERTNHRP
jgi:hypothetical protein